MPTESGTHFNQPARNPQKRSQRRTHVRLSTLLWGLACLILGTLIATGTIPNTATGPRIGLSMALYTLALLFLGIPATSWIIKRTTRPEDYQGTCPVGRVCTCGAFNYNPRTICRSCGQNLEEIEPATRN